MTRTPLSMIVCAQFTHESILQPRAARPVPSPATRAASAFFEVMPIRGELRGLIERSTEEIFAAAVKAGMTTMRQDGIRVVLAGVTSLAEVRRVTGERMT